MSNKKRIFMTGATGCVGHYLVETFLSDPGYELFLLARDKEKFMFEPKPDRVTIVKGQLEDLAKFTGAVQSADILIHVATSWGGDPRINYEIPFKMFSLVAAGRVKRIINFSTASILDENNQILAAAGQYGTEYIKSKLKLYEEIKKQPWADKVTHIFPTLISGGDKDHPYSYITQTFPQIKKWIKLARFFSFDAGCHFIHAADAATLVKYLVDNDKVGDHVLGNRYQTAKELIRQAARYFGCRTWFQIPLPVGSLVSLARLFGATFLPWDLYCARYHRDFRYRAVSPADFGLAVKYPDLASLLKDAGLTRHVKSSFSRMS